MTDVSLEKPKIKIDECLCGGCWAVEKSDVAVQQKWKAYDFLHLHCTVLCPKCQLKFGSEFETMLKKGL